MIRRPCFLAIFAAVLALGGMARGAPATVGGEKKEDSAKAANLEVIMTTMNETLAENKSLLEEMSRLRDAFRLLVVENNFLRAELRTRAEVRPADIESMQRVTHALKTELDRLRAKVQKIARARRAVVVRRKEAEQAMLQLRSENASLKEWVDVLLPERDKVKYMRAPKEAEKTAAEVRPVPTGKIEETIQQELASLYYSLGNLLFQERDYPNAAGKYQKAIELNPDDAWAHYNLGVLYDYYLPDRKAALYHYAKYLQAKPADEPGHEIEERMLEIQLTKELIPKHPLQADYEQYHKHRQV
jgi:tetratricopeptide (TPR) repeat protein